MARDEVLVKLVLEYLAIEEKLDEMRLVYMVTGEISGYQEVTKEWAQKRHELEGRANYVGPLIQS